MAKKSAAQLPAKKPVSPRAAAALAEARQEEIKKRLEAIGPELYVWYQEIDEFERSAVRNVVWAVYKLGQRCNAVHTKYKHNGLKELAWALNKTKEQVEEACRLASRYTDQEIQDFFALRTPSGEPLTKSHILELSSIDDREKRKQFARQAAAEGMTYRQLSEAVQAHYGAARSSGGRGFAQPGSLSGLLSTWTKRSEVLLGFHEQVVTKSLEQLVNDTPPDRLDAAVVEQIDEAAAAIGKLLETAEGDIDRLAELKERVSQVLATRPAVAEGAAPTAATPSAPGPVKALRPKMVGYPKNAAGQIQKPPGKRNPRTPPVKVKAVKPKTKAKR